MVSRGKLFSYSGTAVPARGTSPSILEGVPAGGVVILKYQNSLWKTTIINDIRIKDTYNHNLLENSELIGFACIRFGIRIEFDGEPHNEKADYYIQRDNLYNIKKEL